MQKIKFLFIILIGLFLTHCSTNDDDIIPIVTTPETALESYLDNDDDSYSWSVQSTYSVAGVTAYDILLTSQQWREYKWVHQLTIFVPSAVLYDDALLWITGGSVTNDEPNWTNQSDMENIAFAITAAKNNAIVAIIRQTPNQPLYDALYEDALISYTLQQYTNDGDFTWPLLFPMTKTAVRAMDAVQEFSSDELAHSIDGFVVAGASKRGWTTWLTGAQDNRVIAIAPAVIDMINMPVNISYHLEAWGEYSPQIQDYVNLGIAQAIGSASGMELITMIDPYSYRSKLTMPKLILLGTNDPYWPVDAIKHYYNDIPGHNFIHYVANAGHDLGGGLQAVDALNAFLLNTLQNNSYPECTWSVTEESESVILNVQGTVSELSNALLWTAESADRDFRDEEWTSTEITYDVNGVVNKTITYPESGFKAFYIDLQYNNPNGKYNKSTRMFVTNSSEIL